MKKSIIIILSISLSFLLIQKSIKASEDLMFSIPKWYKILPENFKPIEEDKIKLLENLRVKYRAFHENLIYSILSTPWAVERTQYESLKQAKEMYSHLNKQDLWKVVLLSRFVMLKDTAIFETHEYSKLSSEEFQIKIDKMIENTDLIIRNFNSFSDVVKFAICLEEEMGNFIDPTGIIDEISSILGRGRPSEEDNKWYFSILNKLRDDD